MVIYTILYKFRTTSYHYWSYSVAAGYFAAASYSDYFAAVGYSDFDSDYYFGSVEYCLI